ncbi:hypothetical protein ACFE04_029844 [Oxalis oulophora]
MVASGILNAAVACVLIIYLAIDVVLRKQITTEEDSTSSTIIFYVQLLTANMLNLLPQQIMNVLGLVLLKTISYDEAVQSILEIIIDVIRKTPHSPISNEDEMDDKSILSTKLEKLLALNIDD